MPQQLRVKGEVKKGVIVLIISFGKELLLKTGAREQLSKELTRHYRQIRTEQKTGVNTSCIVKIQAEVAGSPLVRALFELWEEVVSTKGGQVICVNYPPDYIDSLTSLGLTAMPGFSLAASEEDAFAMLT